ncbi:MAG TPA: hypothetical protein V6D14_29265 [Coleofasciculaceae cyanobacterium]|jgi:hypothetical protein
MTQIICLANSWKLEERCIAGINANTGQWIRPVCSLYPKDGRVPASVRLIEGREPALLDILEIPLEEDGADFGFESENLTIAAGKWQRVGQVQPTDVLQYCGNYPQILHNSSKYVTVPYLKSLPFQGRRTLQLVYATKLSVESMARTKGGMSWKGTLVTVTGQRLVNATITDPVFVERLESGYRPQNPCLVTVSLSMPHRPSNEWEGDDPCWKLIAGVIELSESDLILVEMKRLGWTIEQGREYLQRTYNKQSRKQLTATEMTQFLSYLKSLPTGSP